MTEAALLAAVCASSLVGAFATASHEPALASLGPAVTRPKRSFLAHVGSLPVARRIPISDRIRVRLAASGRGWTEREVLGAKALCGALAAVLALVTGAWALAPPLAMLGVRLPDLRLSRLATARLAAANREVPVLLDLLAVATSAGLPPQLALRRAIDAAEGPLAEEMHAVVRATDLGGRWRDELVLAAGRLGLPDLDRTVGALTRSEALGSSLAEEVERLAADVRETRRAAATERARAAPVKMLFPLVFLVLPAFLLLTVVPVLVATVESIR